MAFVFLVVVLISVALIGITALPFADTDFWFVRMADFPRLQILLLILLFVAGLSAFLRSRPASVGLLLAVLLAAGATHAVALWPYRPDRSNFLTSCPADQRVSVLVANVLMGNRTAGPLIEMVGRLEPDIFLALETDEWWDRSLLPLAESMPNRVQEIGNDHYGIHLFSRLPLEDPKIRHFAGQDTPGIVTGVSLRNGERIAFIGLHPRPPQPFQSAIGRDAQLYQAAFALQKAGRLGVVAGDFNATPWESTIERMRRIGGLIDPRRGYGFFATYSAKSWWRFWPLDHVFYQPGFATVSLDRLGAFGSDHYPYFVRLCRTDQAGGYPPPRLQSGDREEAQAAIAVAASQDSDAE